MEGFIMLGGVAILMVIGKVTSVVDKAEPESSIRYEDQSVIPESGIRYEDQSVIPDCSDRYEEHNKTEDDSNGRGKYEVLKTIIKIIVWGEIIWFIPWIIWFVRLCIVLLAEGVPAR